VHGWQNTNIACTSENHQINESELRRRLSATRRFLLGSDSIDSPSQNIDKPLKVLLRKFSSNEWMQDLTLNIDEGKNGNISSPSWFDHSQFIKTNNRSEMGPTLAQMQLFSIHEISPEWAFSFESTKVCCCKWFLL
jgi:calmodulin-binding transcription activator